MSKRNKRQELNPKIPYRKLYKIAVPIAVQGVVSATLGLIDNLMVGFLGEAELASVGIATQFFYIFQLLLFGFTSGIATFVSQFYGIKNYENIRKVVGFAVAVSLGAGAVFFTCGFFFTNGLLRIYTDDLQLLELAGAYVKIGTPCFFFLAASLPLQMAFRSTQQTKFPMIVSLITFFFNIILNYIFIFGKFGAPALGVAGASLATTVVRLFEVSMMIGFALRKGNNFYGPLKSFFGWKKEMIRRIVINAMPTTINEFLWGLSQSMYVAAFTRMGTTAYAAYQAASAINGIYAHAAFSMGNATLVLVGEKLGEGKPKEAYILGKQLMKVGIILGTLIGVLLIFTAKPMVCLFNLTELGNLYTFRILLVYGAFLGLTLYNGMNVTGTLRAGGDTKFAMITECCTVWLIGVPIAFLSSMVLHVPIYLAVLLLRTEDVVKAVLLTKRFLSKKWVNNVIDGL